MREPTPVDEGVGDVEVLYADAARIVRARVPWANGLTVARAVALAAPIAALELDFARIGCAVWGERVEPAHPVQPGDRIELLPPLPNDPKVARRRRVNEARARSGGRVGSAPR